MILNGYRWSADLASTVALSFSHSVSIIPGSFNWEGPADFVERANSNGHYIGSRATPGVPYFFNDEFWFTPEIDSGMIDSQVADFWPSDLNEAGMVVGFNDDYTQMIIRAADGTRSTVNGAAPAAINDFVRTIVNADGTTSQKPCPQILGYSGNDSVLWQRTLDGTAYLRFNLEDMIPNMAGWELHDLTDINDQGMIVGTGIYTDPSNPEAQSENHGFLLVPIRLSQLGLSGQGEHDVVEDASGHTFASVHAPNQWQSSDPEGADQIHRQGWSDPVCFVAGSTMTASVQLKVPGAWSSFASSIKVKGVGASGASSGYDFPVSQVTYDATKKVFSAVILCTKPFPATTVGCIAPLTISWQMSIDSGDNWIAVDTTKTECFVTLSEPNTNPTGDNNYKLYQTVLHYACSNPGATNNDDAVANTWSLFAGPANIKAWNPKTKTYDRPLRYYNKSFAASPQPFTVTGILQEADGFGECYCFGQLFQDALWANGIENQGIVVAPHNGDAVFLVKDWLYSAEGSLADLDADYSWRMAINLLPSVDMQPPPDATHPMQYGDLTNENTLAGQNTLPPLEKVFGSHYIVKYGTSPIYYDPSYGVTYTSNNDFEDKAVDGYGKFYDLTSLKIRKASALQNIDFTDFNKHHE